MPKPELKRAASKKARVWRKGIGSMRKETMQVMELFKRVRVQKLIHIAEKGSPHAKNLAIISLGKLKSKKAIPILEKILKKTKDEETREHALWALEQILGKKGALAIIKEAVGI